MIPDKLFRYRIQFRSLDARLYQLGDLTVSFSQNLGSIHALMANSSSVFK